VLAADRLEIDAGRIDNQFKFQDADVEAQAADSI
jgi:hypothetical protein